MAVLHKKEEKIQAVLGRLPKNYTHEEFVAMFIKLFSKDWGKIKSAYIKHSQDKEPGTVIHMPKPELYLKQVLEIFLAQQRSKIGEEAHPVKVDHVVDEKPLKAKKTVEAKIENVVDKPVKSPRKKALTEKNLSDEVVDKPVKTPRKKADTSSVEDKPGKEPKIATKNKKV